MSEPRVSVIVNTYNRARSLRLTLHALRQLDYPNFEVVVVNGPSTDETETMLAEFEGQIKLARCAHRNLSESRNIGLAAAAGEIVAFIDDDAYPDPAWLTRLVEAYDDPDVAAAGGPTYNHTGAELQAKYSLSNRFGMSRVDNGARNPTPYLNSPYTLEFPYTIGTNSSFRRSELVAIGGFDEEFEYYLEETDACLRLIDRGLVVQVLDDGFVYHKFLSSDIRTDQRAIRDRHSVFKNTCYFALKHGLRYASFAEVCMQLTDFIGHHQRDVQSNRDWGLLDDEDVRRITEDMPRAFDEGFRAHLTGRTRTHPASWYSSPPAFLPFRTLRRAQDRLNIAFFINEWPPMQLNGIARVVHTLSHGLAAAGHVVHVLTRGEDHDRVDLEDGVWVHRVLVRHHEPPADIEVPQTIWNYSASLHEELRRIDAHRPVDVVQVPNWESEGIAVLLAGGFRTVLGLYTPLRTLRAVDALLAQPDRDLEQLERLEQFCYQRADRLLACGPGIVSEIQERYGLQLPAERIGYVAHGLPDVPAEVVPSTDDERPEVLYVGRLEPRKGIDVLLEAIPELADRFPTAHFTIVGKDTHPGLDGRTPRQVFETSEAGSRLAGRVTFTGVLDDDELLRRYATCDVFVAPSRYESFGLILVEAMRFAKPVVGSSAGGMVDIVEEGVNGFLVPPGDVTALRDALARLLESPELRRRFGEQGRRMYEERFSVERMTQGVNREYDLLAGRSTAEVTAAVVEPAPQPGAVVPAVEPVVAPPAVAPPAPVLADPIVERLHCPRCGAAPQVVARTVTAGGRLKAGQVVCPRCGVVGVVRNFKLDFRPGTVELDPGPLRTVPELGERRLRPGSDELVLRGDWYRFENWLHSDGALSDSIHHESRFTDAVVRLLQHASAGVVDIFVDGTLATTVDLSDAEGSTVVGIQVAEDLEFGRHSITIRPRKLPQGPGQATAPQVSFDELVLYGPLGQDGFGARSAINRGNPYSAVIERFIAGCPPQGMILEVGGGDRRGANPRHLNAEYLKFELADVYADTHRLPFADGSFARVFSQAVFEHLANPFEVAEELVRVTEPGGLILTEVAFMQPLHAHPYHFFNMTLWGVQELFKSCELVESDWFGELSSTVDWLMRSVKLQEKLSAEDYERISAEFRRLDGLVSHDELRPAASGVYIVVRKPKV